MKRLVGPIIMTAALLLAVIALVISILTLYGLLQIRQGGLAAIGEARSALSELDNYTFETVIPFEQTFPIQADVPLQQEFTVPIRTTIPISTTVQVPIQIPLLGTYQLAVPVITDVPINLQVVIPISQTVGVETTIEVDTEVPIRVDMEQLGLENLVEQVDTVLEEIEGGLQGPFDGQD